MDFILGILTGCVSLYVVGIIVKNIRQKKGRRLSDYNKAPIFKKLTDTLRHIVFEYSIKRKNKNFSLNVSLNKQLRLQVLHRSHFPELAKSEEDISFGLALYIPVNNLEKVQKDKLIEILKEESEIYYYDDVPFDYYILDIGKRIRFGGYLLTRILKDVFKANEDSNAVTFELFTEGEIPYFGLKEHPKRS